MHLLMITGFLGAGKTTLLLRLAEFARNKDKKVAIIVNEIGDIGVDNQLMQQLGFNVRELLGGCICCSLAGDIIDTLRELQGQDQPDLVLLEPTGAADPKNLIKILDANKHFFFKSLTKIALIDPLRMEMLMAVASPLILSTLELADVTLINKADAAIPEELKYTRKIALKYAPANRIITISAKNKLTDRLTRRLLPWIRLK